MKEHKERSICKAKTGDDELGPLKLLPGKWKSVPNQGWNMIALPFFDKDTVAKDRFNYRVLVNSFDEKLKFSLVDKAVPNRGLGHDKSGGVRFNTDQLVVTLDYEQMITQTDSADFPNSGLAGAPGLAIHHEPGLWLHMVNETTNNIDLARLATIPHGDSLLALGSSSRADGAPDIPMIRGLPIGTVPVDLNTNPYLAPYKHFHENPFKGVYDPTNPTALLQKANDCIDIKRTTTLTVDTEVESGGIKNIPFVTRQANAGSMRSIFWIEELVEKDKHGRPKLRLQYAQVVILEFFGRLDQLPGLAQWPHVSINTLEKVYD